MAKRKYNGCELSSPLYRQIAAEMARGKKKTVVINEVNVPGANLKVPIPKKVTIK